MGNVPAKRPPSKTGVASAQLRRSQSMAANGRRTPSLPETNGVPKLIENGIGNSSPNPKTATQIRRKSKTFHSTTNIAGAGTGSTDGHPHLLHPAPEKYILTGAQREMIRGNWEANRDRRYDISRRIYGRAFNKRPDIREIFEHMGAELWAEEAQKFADFLEVIIHNLDDLCTIERLSLEMGRRHSEWRQQGFKPEFWVALAESMTKECVYLDAAVHPAGEVLEAWSRLVGLIFGWARDGFYEKVRLQRRLSRKVVMKSTSASSRSLSGSSRSDSIDDQAITNGHSNGSVLPSIASAGSPSSDTLTLT